MSSRPVRVDLLLGERERLANDPHLKDIPGAYREHAKALLRLESAVRAGPPPVKGVVRRERGRGESLWLDSVAATRETSQIGDATARAGGPAMFCKCCQCDGLFELEDVSAGQKVECPFCGGHTEAAPIRFLDGQKAAELLGALRDQRVNVENLEAELADERRESSELRSKVDGLEWELKHWETGVNRLMSDVERTGRWRTFGVICMCVGSGLVYACSYRWLGEAAAALLSGLLWCSLILGLMPRLDGTDLFPS